MCILSEGARELSELLQAQNSICLYVDVYQCVCMYIYKFIYIYIYLYLLG